MKSAWTEKPKVGGKMPDWKKLEGKRILVGTKSGNIFEAVVKEVSKSGKYVKLQFPGTTIWNDTNNMQFEFLEVLD